MFKSICVFFSPFIQVDATDLTVDPRIFHAVHGFGHFLNNLFCKLIQFKCIYSCPVGGSCSKRCIIVLILTYLFTTYLWCLHRTQKTKNTAILISSGLIVMQK